jgi:hypothetical protein
VRAGHHHAALHERRRQQEQRRGQGEGRGNPEKGSTRALRVFNVSASCWGLYKLNSVESVCLCEITKLAKSVWSQPLKLKIVFPVSNFAFTESTVTTPRRSPRPSTRSTFARWWRRGGRPTRPRWGLLQGAAAYDSSTHFYFTSFLVFAACSLIVLLRAA